MRENRVRTRDSVLNTREIIENEIPLLMKSFLHGAKEKVGEKERNRNLSAQFPRKLEGRSSERLNSNRLDSESQSFVEGRRAPGNSEKTTIPSRFLPRNDDEKSEPSNDVENRG